MNCERCGNELFIVGSCIEVTGDTSAEEETVVYRLLSFVCRNPQCGCAGETVEKRIRLN